ncbi:hypothetical protein Tco_1299766 [Tanacetum coccineum]
MESLRPSHQESVDVSDESKPEPPKKKTGSKSTRGVVIQDTPSAPNPKLATSKLKLKGVQSLTPEEQEAADTMQALKESKKTSRRQPDTGASSEGTGRIPWVPDVSTVISTTLSEGNDSQLNSIKKEKKDNDGDGDDEDEDDDHVSDSQDTDDEDAETESDKDEIYKYKIQVHKDVDVEMKEAKTVERENKEKVEMTDAAKFDVEKTAEEKGDAELARNAMTSNYQVKESIEFPLPSSSLSVSFGCGLSPPQVTPTISIIQQRTTPIPTPLITTEAPTIITTVLESDALTAIQLRVAKLEKDVSELKKIDHSAEALASLKSQVPMVVEHYLGSKVGDDLQKVLQRHTADLIQKYYVKPAP